MIAGAWLAFAATAGGTVPEAVRPVVAPVDAPAQFRAWSVAHGGPAELACDALWPDQALLCFRIREGSTRRWVTTADVSGWGVDLAAVRAAMVDRAASHLAPEGRPVEGLNATFWQAVDGDGWAAAGVLRPGDLSRALGDGPLAVAMPTDQILIAWHPGREEVDRAVAVGIHELWDGKDGAVSAVAFTWDGASWAPWGVATPRAK